MRVKDLENLKEFFEVLLSLGVLSFGDANLKSDRGIVKQVFIFVLKLGFKV